MTALCFGVRGSVGVKIRVRAVFRIRVGVRVELRVRVLQKKI